MKWNKSAVLLVGLTGVAAVFCLWMALRPAESLDLDERAAVTSMQSVLDFESVPSAPETAESAGSTYVSPIDFKALLQANSDIYAWLEIPDTGINYPIVQHPVDQNYYLDHDSKGNLSADGALFTEKNYNGMDFQDAVTVIYGHNMKSGSMFGNLQALYSDEKGFSNNQTIKVYLPERELTYRVFAAVPYSSLHLLYYYSFESPKSFREFFDTVYAVRSLDAQVDEAAKPEAGDEVLMLSTCLMGNRDKRYLVMAALEQSD